MHCLNCNIEVENSVDDYIYKDILLCPVCQIELTCDCDYCKWAGLFYCIHRLHWTKEFRINENCEMFEKLPNDAKRVRVDWKYKCHKCKKEFHIDDLESSGKGSNLICKGCR